MAQNIGGTPGNTSCNVPKCNKTLKNKLNLNSHMEKVHKVVNAISESPLVNTVRTLFSAENTGVQSTQGISTCDKIPQRRIDQSFQCHVCENSCKTNEALIEHAKIHDAAVPNAENDEDEDEVARELANMANIVEG